ncbi:MAG: hypothetical protein ABII19_01605 [Patescibacteria group bacterium]
MRGGLCSLVIYFLAFSQGGKKDEKGSRSFRSGARIRSGGFCFGRRRRLARKWRDDLRGPAGRSIGAPGGGVWPDWGRDPGGQSAFGLRHSLRQAKEDRASGRDDSVRLRSAEDLPHRRQDAHRS